MPSAEIVVADGGNGIVGFVTVDPRTLYLDQIVVAPEHWGSDVGVRLMAEAKRLSPAGLDLDVNTDNARAIRFYEKQALFDQRRRRQSDLRQAGSSHELAALSQLDQTPPHISATADDVRASTYALGRYKASDQ